MIQPGQPSRTFRNYDELRGGQAPDPVFRIEPIDVRRVFPRLAPSLRAGEVPMRLSAIAPDRLLATIDRQTPWEGAPGTLYELDLRLGEYILFRGEAVTTHIERTAFCARVTLAIVGARLDLAKFAAAHEACALEAEINDGLRSEALVAEAYRRHAADLLQWLRRYRNILTQVERAHDEATADRLLALCEERILPEWRRRWLEGNALVRDIAEDPEVFRATKRFTELVVSPEFAAGPLWKRTWEKPLGYPGDYEVMNQIYQWRLIGETRFAKLVHRLGLDCLECVASRMTLVQQAINRTLNERQDQALVRITNLGCGTAQEVHNFVTAERPHAPVHFTLIDQDTEPLTLIQNRTWPEILRQKRPITLDCWHLSFLDIVEGKAAFKNLPPQDLVYSVGLLDYLSEKRARALVKSLYEKVAPGGSLLVANLRDAPLSGFWPAEFICDWSMVYRSEAEMLRLAEGLGAAAVDLRTDETGLVYMLALDKPAEPAPEAAAR
jgi:hypothetical protein